MSALREWLERLGLARYADRFEADDIDLDVLPSLTEQDLEKLGVSMGHRKKLLRAMAELGGAASPPVAPDATAVVYTRTRPADQPEARKVVTILFADLAGSTALHERLDPESVRRFMEGYYRSMRATIETHGGTLVKLLGDGVMAAFGVPRVAEDDAIRAVRAGVAMQEAFGTLAQQEFAAVGAIGLRVGINTGEVVVGADNTDVVGDPVNVAARLQAEAKDGQVVIGESTRRLVGGRVTLAPLGSFALRGRAEAIKAYRVESLDPAVGTSATPFVGRDDELARLMAVYAAAIGTPAARLAVLLGSPGLGKSRLIEEVTHRLGDVANVVTAHCDAAAGATFAPVAAALRAFFQIEAGASPPSVKATVEAAIPATDPERTRIAAGIAALLAGSPASPEETFFVIRRLLTGVAAAQPVVLVIDDLQWAEPLLLDLVEHLVQWGSGTPLLVLVGARPELRDLRSSLVTPGGLVSDVVTLSGLDAGAAMRLAANVIGAADLPAAVAAKVLATSEGNPLFVGELVRMLVDEGAIERQGDRWIVGANLAALEMPPTIHALLAARIERLGPEERTVLERAAIVGRHFSRSAVAALLGRNGSQLDARLEALRRTELIERDTGWFLGEPVLRFHHVLIRDAAYRRVLKGTRAELHEQLANWIEAQVGEAPEHDETVGWHLEQAHQHRRELGPLDTSGKVLGERAAARLASAGRRALARDDLPVAAGLLGRALERLGADDPARADLALDWCEALLASGDVGAAETAINEIGRFTGGPVAGRNPRLAAWHTCFTGQLTVLTAPEALHTTADAVAVAATELASLDDAAGEAKAHFVHALALARLGKVGGCEAALDKALAAARRADDRRRANTVLAIAPLAALWGPSPVTRASGRCLDVVRVLRITQGAPAVESVALSCQAVLEALRGRTDAARRMLASSRKMVEELGITHRLLEADAFGGLIDLLEGDTSAAEQSLRRAYDGLRDLGLGIDAARAAALLARALLAQDRGAEAEALSHESETLAGDDLKAAIAWRGVRAEALARRGEHTAAVELAQAAVEIAAATDALLDHADARLALAAALRAAGRGADAEVEQRRAIELWEAKGASVLAERTRGSGPRVAATVDERPAHGVAAAHRRVVPNRASATLPSFNAAMAAPEGAAFRDALSEGFEEIDHPTGSSYGREATVAALVHHMRSRDASLRVEPLATLGDALVLCRRRVYASATGGGRFDVGEYEQDAYTVLEVDALGRYRRHEVFAVDHLLDAVARLYERHAELLPAGPERERAAATARTIAMCIGPIDSERWAAMVDARVENVDHRTLGTWNARGRGAYLTQLREQVELAAGAMLRMDEVLALTPRAVLNRNTWSGVVRATGELFENVVLELWVWGADGFLVRGEIWEPEQEAAALARFDELVTLAEPLRAVPRRVTPNAATETVERFEAAVAARDLDAFERALCEEIESVHHQTGTTWDRKGLLATWRSIFRTDKVARRRATIASLGDTLALARHTISLEGFAEAHLAAVGAVEVDEVVLFEVDERGQVRRFEIFPAEKLGPAVIRLYTRHAELLPEGPERERAAAMARSVAAFWGRVDVDLLAAAVAPAFEQIDHRIFATWSATGAEAALEHIRALHAVARDVDWSLDDVLGVRADALLGRYTHTGTDRNSGGRYEREALLLIVGGVDGRAIHLEFFATEHAAAALARFDALTTDPGQMVSGTGEAPRLVKGRRLRPNAATARWAHHAAALAARDFQAVAAGCHEETRQIDHLTGTEYGREAVIASLKGLFRSRDPYFDVEPLATLGERLLLFHRRAGASGETRGRYDVGPYENDAIELGEVDAHGLSYRNEIFAVDRLGAAIVRLYERHAELLPEGPERTRAAGIARALAAYDGPVDVDRLRAAFDPTHQCVDHRVFNTWSAGDAEGILQHFRLQCDLAPDFSGRYDDVFAANERALVGCTTFFGTARDGGGLFEKRCCLLIRFAADGRMIHTECWEAEQIAGALARFDEVTGADTDAGADWFENAAARTDRELFERFNVRDWPGIEALAAPNLVFDERRRMLRKSCGRDVWLEQFRVLYDVPASHFTTQLLATRGDRLSLSLHQFAGEVAGGGGPVEMDDHLVLHEVDAAGRLTAIVLFDLDDQHAARAELDARWEAGEGAAFSAHVVFMQAWNRAIASRDWTPVLALMSGPSFIEDDHRALAVLGTTRGADAWVENFRTLLDLAPDSTYRVEHFRSATRGFWCVGTWLGSREGGGYELPISAVIELDEHDRVARADIYDLHQHGEARARFTGLTAAIAVPDRFANAATATVGYYEPRHLDRAHERFEATGASRSDDRVLPAAGLAFAPTPATRSTERFWQALDAADFETMRVLFAPGFTWEDRRPLFRLSGGFELMLASAKERLATGARHERRAIVGTAGDRVAIGRVLWAGGPPGGRFEVEFLTVQEVDEAGLCTAMVFFDPDDPRAAQREAWARWVAIDPTVAEVTAGVGQMLDAWNAKDLGRLRASYAEDLVVEDHRWTGTGRIEGREAYLRSVTALWELAPESQLDAGWFWLAVTPRGGVSTCQRSGKLPGGGEFVSDFLVVNVLERGITTRVEVFEVGAAEAAVARFEALRANPLRIPPNAVTRTWDRWWSAVTANDRDAIPRLYAPDYRFDDRRRLFRMSTDLSQTLTGDYLLLEDGWRPVRTLLATMGDRLALQHILWTTGDPGAPSEIETLMVSEVDRDGRFLHGAAFEPDDRAAAGAELFERWVANGAEGVPQRVIEIGRAWNAHDLDRLRTLLPADFYLDDHRRTGVGRLDGADACLASLAAMFGLSRDLRAEALYIVSTTSHGVVWVARWAGGGCDTICVCLGLCRGDHLLGLEIFEIDYLDVARARFAELGAVRTT